MQEKKSPSIYLDHASTTPVRDEVVQAMAPYWQEQYGNPSSLHELGRAARVALDNAREIVAGIFGSQFNEIIFTGSGTESDNLAILGTARRQGRGHIITTAIEHHAVLHSCQYLETQGFFVTYLKPDAEGFITAEQVIRALREDTILVSIMYANNEIGTIEPIAAIGRALGRWKQEHGRATKNNRAVLPYFHTDACQAAGLLDLKVPELGVDLMTINASKIGGPKGVGALFVREGVELEPLVFGGGQERGLRSGTESVPLIVGLAEALRLAQQERLAEYKRLSSLRDWFIAEIKKIIPRTIVNGPRGEQRLANNIHLSIPDTDSETLLFLLDQAGIYASTGSACTAGIIEPSHVLVACSASPELARSSLRFTLGKKTTQAELEYVLERLARII